MTAKKHKIRNFWIRAPIFLVILLAALIYTLYVLTPKYDYGICPMINLYQQPEDTVDVLAVGTSQTYGGVNTNILWEDYGIAAYDLATAEQAYWVAYYYIKEALKYQSPELIVLDAKTSSYPDSVNTDARTILGTFGILSPSVRNDAIKQCTGKEDTLDFWLGFSKLHSFYPEVTAASFAVLPDNGGRGSDWKGYIEQDETEKHERPSLVWTSTKKAVNEHEMEYFRMILDLCREKGIQVLLVSYPYPDYASDHMYVNTLFSVAEEYENVTAINYNNPDLRFGLRYSSDFADWQHLNIKGAANFSKKLAEDIKELYEIPDRRGDSRYESYDSCAEKWFAEYPEYLETS